MPRIAFAGHVSAQRLADTWVKTTCGYCSVGCGMLVGVKDGRAVTTRGNPDHPVNRGKLCPKGLAEHYAISAPGRATHPLLRRNGSLEPVSWAEALDTMAAEFLRVQERYGRDAVGVISTGQLVTEEFYTLGKLVQLGLGTRNYRRQHHALHVHARSPATRDRSAAMALRAATRISREADVILLIGANIAENHPILCQHLDETRTRR